jgi:hypothetical protein
MLKRDPLDCSAEGLEHEDKQAKFRAQFASKWRPSHREDRCEQFVQYCSCRSAAWSCCVEEAEVKYGDLPILDDQKRALLEICKQRKTAYFTN